MVMISVPAIIAVPTTAGTGSEVGRAGVVTHPITHEKKIIFHPAIMPKVAILDPELGLMQVRQFHYGWNASGPRETTLPLGTALHGAVVVIDVQTGEPLALVSTPTFADLELAAEDLALMLMPDADARTLPEEQRRRRRTLQDLAPFRNRAIGTAYAPGSRHDLR